MLDDSWDGNDLVAAHHEGPCLALRAWDLGVDEHVLDLLLPAGKPVARPPASYLKACELRLDRPLAPANRSLERHGAALEPGAVVLADELDPVAEIEPFRAGRRSDELGEGGLERGALLEGAQEGQDAFADQPACRVLVGAVTAVVEPLRPAVGLGLPPPDRQQRTDDPVLALRLDPCRAAARHQPVEDRLDLVGGGVPGGSEPVGREAVPNLPQFDLGRSAAAVDDLGPQQLATEASVFVGFFSAPPMVDVEGGNAVAELAKN